MTDKTENTMEYRIPLPEAFRQKMKALLGQEYETFSESCEKERSQGLRLNPLRFETPGREENRDEEAEASAAKDLEDIEMKQKLRDKFGLRPVPWAEDGYYYETETRPGRHPYHEAGLYYIQEPSAMAVAELLNPKPGERILDLCAAPGGKSTQIAGKMRGKGLLIANEIHPERARILSQNIERMGIGSAVVTNETPKRLSETFHEFFDRVLVDAPCSGEGMFRKDEAARQEWSPEHVAMCARRQAEILDCAAGMLRPGGRLVYSTCTFSPEENEGNIRSFLERHREFSVEKPGGSKGAVCKDFSPGRPEWLKEGTSEEGKVSADREVKGKVSADREAEIRRALANTIRIWPHRAEGEGHYIAVLRKEGPEFSGAETADVRKAQRKRESGSLGNREKEISVLWKGFCRDNLNTDPADGSGRLLMFGDQLYLQPEPFIDFRGLKVLRPGLHLGTVKKNRLEPSHALALWLRREQVKRWYSLPAESPAMERYLRGETLEITEVPADSEGLSGSEGPTGSEGLTGSENPAGSKGLTGNGWVLVLADGYSVGWAKQVGATLKNHYPKGLRKNP